MIRKILKMLGILIGSVVLLLIIVGALFINLSPEFGGKPTKEDQLRYEKSPLYKDGIFVNPIPTSLDMSFGTMVGTLVEFIKGTPNAKPSVELPIIENDSIDIANFKAGDRLIWFGHSAFLLQIDGKNILLDPMLGNVPAPHPLLGGNRYNTKLPIEIEKLPRIDAVLISHDHYDHLDYGSIKKLKEKTNQFLVPLGVGAHLKAWGIETNKISEFDWWQELTYEHLKLSFTPSRHFSGRGLTDRATTLWGSWVIKGNNSNLYFSGDGGYGEHFKEIGAKYGPFDFAMMECGQYNEKWHDIHMMPEETAQAAVDVNTKVMMPIHWGAFTLALHSWTDPVERVSAKAKELNQDMIIPKIGESIGLDSSIAVADSYWWKNLEAGN